MLTNRILTTSSNIMCPHGGRAKLVTSNTQIHVDGALALLQNDKHSVVGCPFTIGTKYSPCKRIEWSAGTSRTKMYETPLLIETSKGKCFTEEGLLQGIAVIVNTQTRVDAQ